MEPNIHPPNRNIPPKPYQQYQNPNIPNKNIPPAPNQQAVKSATKKKFNFKKLFLFIVVVFAGAAAAKLGFDYGVPLIGEKLAGGKKILTSSSASSLQAKSGKATKAVDTKQKPEPYITPKIEKPTIISSTVKKIKETTTAFVLNGIFTDGKSQSTALINNHAVEEGSNVDGALVKKILPETVELEFQGKIITLTIK
jgi:hypothetical protein